jgi:hypothetical protein
VGCRYEYGNREHDQGNHGVNGMKNLGTTLPEDLNMWQVYKMIIKGQAVCACYKCGYTFTQSDDDDWLPGLLDGKFICIRCDKRKREEIC